jgi:hypothetical protein
MNNLADIKGKSDETQYFTQVTTIGSSRAMICTSEEGMGDSKWGRIDHSLTYLAFASSLLVPIERYKQGVFNRPYTDHC